MNSASAHDIYLFGAERTPSITKHIHAGPVRAKFEDGELRYMYVGEKEIVRRVYFGVRDQRWDTVMPQITDCSADIETDRFSISFNAHCKNDVADYSWNGRIIGTPDGKIDFSVQGTANSTFQAPRLGINILYGTTSLGGQKYELIDDRGRVSRGAFPTRVTPELLADFNSFRILRYTTDDGMTVSTSLDSQCIGMEDQRNFGDSSYKAFSSMSYQYPTVPKGEVRSQTFTLRVDNPSIGEDLGRPILTSLGNRLSGRKIPAITDSEPGRPDDFRTYNLDTWKYRDKKVVRLPYNPALHMPDEDTFMENIPTIYDWGQTIRECTPAARIRLDPVSFDSPYPRPASDSRIAGLFAAAWNARVMKYLALAGVDEAAFPHAESYGAAILERFRAFCGEEIIDTKISSLCPHAVDAFGVEKSGRLTIWLINLTDSAQTVSLDGVGDIHSIMAVGVNIPAGCPNPSAIPIPPYEVLELTATR